MAQQYPRTCCRYCYQGYASQTPPDNRTRIRDCTRLHGTSPLCPCYCQTARTSRAACRSSALISSKDDQASVRASVQVMVLE